MRSLALTAFLLLTAGGATAAPEPADLMPFSTLVHLEVRHPDKLAAEVSELVKGTGLDRLPGLRARMRSEVPGNRFYGMDPLGTMSLLLGPETVGEFGRLDGLAVALTGFDPDGNPEIVGLIHAGDSNIPALFTRFALQTGEVRLLAEVEKVGLYQSGHTVLRKPIEGEPERPPEWRPSGPVVAELPGVIVLASSPAAAKDVVLRSVGKGGPSLASSRAYRNAAALREKPGLYLTADPAALTLAIDGILARKDVPFVRQWEAIKAVLGPDAVKRLDAALTIQGGDLHLTATAKLEPDREHAPTAMLPAGPPKLATLAGVSADPWGVVAVGVDNPAAKLKTVLAVIDGFAEKQGRPKVSGQLPALEKQLGFEIARDVIGRIEEVALAIDRPGGVYIVAARDEDAAKFLSETALPRVQKMIHEQEVGKVEKVGGHELTVYPGQLTVARRGRLLFVGQDPADMAKHLDGLAGKTFSAAERHVAAVKTAAGAQCVCVVAPRALPAAVMLQLFGFDQARTYLLAFQQEATTPVEKLSRRVGDGLDGLKPLVIDATRDGTSLTIRARLEGVRAVLPKVLDELTSGVIAVEREQRKAAPEPGREP